MLTIVGYEITRVFPFLQGLWNMESYSISSTSRVRGFEVLKFLLLPVISNKILD